MLIKTTLVISFALILPSSSVRYRYPSYQPPVQPADNSLVCVDGLKAKKCDGDVECPDGEDELRGLCHDTVCQPDQFRCAYGGCLPQKKVCDGRRDCADGTDEIQPHCREAVGFICEDGQRTESWEVCDGRFSCIDESDETQQLCANASCHSKQFQCSYGACLYHGKPCDGVPDCTDRSDETATACGTNQCKRNEFRCAYGACVNENMLCHNLRACPDDSDLQTYCQSSVRGQFQCSNGDFIPSWRLCNGRTNCHDGSDETAELCADAKCHSNQFKCNYGGCLYYGAACDGSVDCIDGSDETEDTCRSIKCEETQFRCGYGACIPKDDVCDGYPDCADKSDEDHLLCQNKTSTEWLQFHCGYGAWVKLYPCFWLHGVVSYRPCNENKISSTFFRCQNGERVYPGNMCNGRYDCEDKSDEAAILCSNVKRMGCQNGACSFIYPKVACDGYKDCFDGSDESRDMCDSLRCVVPPPPDHGHLYSAQTTNPGDMVDSLKLSIVCDEGYTVNSTTNEVYCNGGVWSIYPLPKCVRYCTLESDPSIAYRCVDAGGAPEETRACRSRELAGARAMPACRAPAPHPAHALPHITCVDGAWDSTPNCTTECGLVTPVGEALAAGGRPADLGELPWHAGIYQMVKNHYVQVGSGSLVKRNVVISAAHCFWDFNIIQNKYMQLPAEDFAVAVGKVYRRWKHHLDTNAQSSVVSKIILPKDFEGEAKNYQADIAVVVVASDFEYKSHIRPVCLNFDSATDELQLQVGRKGKAAGWGLTGANSKKSKKLNVVELPYVDTDLCNERYPMEFKQYLTLDKFCAGYINESTALCPGDSGSGLAFPETYNGEERYFLRGIASVAPVTNAACNVHFYVTMTKLMTHENFIKHNY